MATLNPYDKAHELARSIVGSDIYKTYIQAQDKVQNQPDLLEKLQAWREKQLVLEEARLLGKNLPEDQMQEMNQLLQEVHGKPELADLLQAENTFIQMFTDLQEIIQRAIQDGFKI